MRTIIMRKPDSPIAKAIFVGGVTMFCTFLGCWAMLAHQGHTANDEQFAVKAAKAGNAEVKLGQLAQEKGSNEAVKQFGQRMVQDHSKASTELKLAAAKENIVLPTGGLDAEDQATYDALSKLSGSAFDKAYVRDMVKDHLADIAEFNREAASGHKDSIRQFASQTLPTLGDHLKQAREMRRAVAGASSAMKKTSRKTQ